MANLGISGVDQSLSPELSALMLKCSQGAQIQSRSSASSWDQAGSLHPLRWLVAMLRLSKVIVVGLGELLCVLRGVGELS